MELKELEAIIEKGIDAKELRFICQLRTYIALDKQIFYHTKKVLGGFNNKFLVKEVDNR